MEKFFALFCMAIVIEGVITYWKTIVTIGDDGKLKIQWPMVAAIIIGVGVSVAYRLDLLAELGLVSTVPLIGNALTGILLSRGSNFIYDLIGKLTKIKTSEV